MDHLGPQQWRMPLLSRACKQFIIYKVPHWLSKRSCLGIAQDSSRQEYIRKSWPELECLIFFFSPRLIGDDNKLSKCRPADRLFDKVSPWGHRASRCSKGWVNIGTTVLERCWVCLCPMQQSGKAAVRVIGLLRRALSDHRPENPSILCNGGHPPLIYTYTL